jgi:extradiol dioxygenase family protein
MFSHIMIGTNDIEKAKAFYDALLGTLGIRPGRLRVSRTAVCVSFTAHQAVCSLLHSRSTASPQHMEMAKPSALRPRRLNRPTHGTKRASPPAASRSRIRPACV